MTARREAVVIPTLLEIARAAVGPAATGPEARARFSVLDLGTEALPAGRLLGGPLDGASTRRAERLVALLAALGNEPVARIRRKVGRGLCPSLEWNLVARRRAARGPDDDDDDETAYDPEPYLAWRAQEERGGVLSFRLASRVRLEVGSAAEAAEVWEARGLVPQGFFDPAARVLAVEGRAECPACGARCRAGESESACMCDAACAVCTDSAQAPFADHPRRAHALSAALALALDPHGVLTAEELLRVAARRTLPWKIDPSRAEDTEGAGGHEAPARWRVVARDGWRPRALWGLTPACDALLTRVGHDPDLPRIAGRFLDAMHGASPLSTAQGAFPEVLGLAYLWAAAACRELRVPEWMACGVAGKPFASLPDPFEPLLALGRLGYAVDRVGRAGETPPGTLVAAHVLAGT